MTPFRDHLIAACTAKAKDLGRKLTSLEIVDLACLSHDVCMPAIKAPRNATPIADGAEQVYALYPRKIAPDAAKKAITIVLKKHELPYLLDKTNQFAEAVRSWPSSYRYKSDGMDLCPHPATWFNRGSYADDPKEWKRFGSRKSVEHQYIPPAEPHGWRSTFPDFVDADKPWNQLQPAQHAYILSAMNTGHHFSEPVEQLEQEQSLRNA